MIRPSFRYNLLPALLAAVLFFHCDNRSNPVASSDNVDNTNFTASENFTFQVNHSTETALQVEAINGEVIVTGKTGADAIIISGRKIVGSESVADAEAHLDDLEVSVSSQGDAVIVRTSQPSETYGRSYIVDYTITVPTDLTVDIGAVNGNVSIDSTTQQATVGLTNGQVLLTDVWSPSTVRLTNGQIFAGILAPQTANPIMADMSTVNGNIEIHIPASASATLSASVTNGIITTSNLDIQNMNSTAHSLTGTLGDGEGSIRLETTNGNITVTGS